MTDTRVAGLSAQILSQRDPDVRVAGLAAQTLSKRSPDHRVASESLLVLTAATSDVTVTLGQASETDVAQAMTPELGSAIIALGQAIETDLAQALTPVAAGANQTVALGQASETDVALVMTPAAAGANQTVAVGQAVEMDVAQVLTPVMSLFDQTIALGQAVETDIATAMLVGGVIPVTQVLEIHGPGRVFIDAEYVAVAWEASLVVLDPELRRAPTTAVFVFTGGVAQVPLELYLDDETEPIWVGDTNSDGAVVPTSVLIPETVLAGEHTLTARIADEDVASATFTLGLNATTHPPSDMGADAQAVEIPGAVQHDTRHWVFQDLLAESEGGIGSYVLPINPREMSSPHYQHTMTGQHTTAITGQYHIFQTGQTPKEWTFSGYCHTQEMQEKLLAYRNLNRRFYIIDHRNRAWKVLITSAEFVPRKVHTFNGVRDDWGSDYTITSMVLDQTPGVPA